MHICTETKLKAMMHGLITAVACLILQSTASVFLSGGLCPEDMDEETTERLNYLANHPIGINYASKSRLKECGLFSAFQIASLLEYRERSGDILSFGELSRLDGWNAEFVEALREYIDLAGAGAVGESSARKSFHGDATGRYGSGSYLTKVSMEWNDRWAVFVSSKKSLPLNLSASYYGRGPLSKVVVGNYNARFAQGLAMWSGFRMSGLPTVEALSRRESGISASHSTSSACNGVAAEFGWGKWTLSAGTNLQQAKNVLRLSAFSNLNYLWRKGQCGITAIVGAGMQTVSANWRVRLGKTDFYGEAAWEFAGRAPAAMVGIRMDPGWKIAWGLTARYYSPKFEGRWSGAPGSFSKNSDEAGLAAVLRYHWINVSADSAYRPEKRFWQTKAIVNLSPEIQAGGVVLSPVLKYSLRWKAGELSESAAAAALKHELRAELKAGIGPWAAGLRGDLTHCLDFAWLALAEAGYKKENCAFFLHAEYFDVRNWDDRIYVYQRDVPGSFNVPARNGRGLSFSLSGGYTLKGRKSRLIHKLNARAGTVLYHKDTQKPSTFEWRVQYALKW